MGTGGGGKTARHRLQGQNFLAEQRMQGIAMDPDLMSARSVAMGLGKGLDLLNAPRIQARRSADTAQQGISSALAARGGGQFADALLQGTRSRVGTELAGLIQGQQAELGMRTTRANLFHQIGATRQGLLNAVLGTQANVTGQAVPAMYQYDADMAQLQSDQMMKMMAGMGGTGIADLLGVGPAGAGGPLSGGLFNAFGLFGGGGGAAAAGGAAPLLCWVADELFGKDSVKTSHARLWANTHDNWFTRRYAKYGRTWAKWVKSSRVARAVAWPIWTYMAQLGKRQAESLGSERWLIG